MFRVDAYRGDAFGCHRVRTRGARGVRLTFLGHRVRGRVGGFATTTRAREGRQGFPRAPEKSKGFGVRGKFDAEKC